ncbi:MAG: NAD-dependent epimerase/dehydratase family protein [Candidatus Babeliaceae bacterium]|jgi:nucleoside-diphosphate-sugar epimerase
MYRNNIFFLSYLVIILFIHDNKAGFYAAYEDNQAVAFCYYLAPITNNNDCGWSNFHNSALNIDQMLHDAQLKNIPTYVILPSYYHNTSPLSEDAPFIEGARCALTWAKYYGATIILYDRDTSINVNAHMYYREIQYEYKNNNKVVFDSDFDQVASLGTVLISGGAGFLGSHLVGKLLDRGYCVIALDNLSTCNKENITPYLNNKNFKFIHHDVSIPCEFNSPLTHIIHAASLPSPEYYYNKPRETLITGLHGTKNLLDIAIQHNAQFLFTSTSEVYGDPRVHPQPEDYAGNVDPMGKRAQYDQSKRGGETLISLYFKKYYLDVRIARIFNTYGPHMSLNDGRVVTNFIKAVFEQKPLKIYGSGLQTRSFAYVDDTVDGIIKLMTSAHITPQTAIADRVVNIGTPEEFTVEALARKVVDLASKYCNYTPQIIHIEQPDMYDPKIRRPDISRAKALLNFEPSVPLDEGLKKTFLFFLTNH